MGATEEQVVPPAGTIAAEAAHSSSLGHLIEQTLGVDLRHLAERFLTTVLGAARAEAGFILFIREGHARVGAARGYEAQVLNSLTFSFTPTVRTVSFVEAVSSGALPEAWKTHAFLYVPLALRDTMHGAVFVRLESGRIADAERQALLEFCHLGTLTTASIGLLRSMAFDLATGVHSPNHFHTRLEEEVARASRYHRKLAVGYIEIDRYHLIHELSGAAVTTAIAKTLASLLRDSLRKVDIVGRTQEDVFAILLPETSTKVARTIVERIAQRISSLEFAEAGQKIEVSLSIALLAVPDDVADVPTLLERSNELLSRARRDGGNRIVEAEAGGMPESAPDRSGADDIEHMVLSREGRTLLGLVTRMVRGTGLSISHFLDHILATLVEIAHAKKGMFSLLDAQGKPDPALTRYYGRAVQPDRAVIEKVLRERKTLVYTEASDPSPDGTRTGVAHAVCAPVIYDQRPLAVVYLKGDPSAPRTLPEEVSFVEASIAYLAGPIHNAMLFTQQKQELSQVREELASSIAQLKTKYSYANIIGRSAPMSRIFQILDKVVESHHPVLIQGESGTGKELVARAIHYNGPRREKPFVAENCAALPGTLLEAELFGYVKGAFTGAVGDKKGLLEVANGGTFFLDEVGEMSLEMQTKLLRVLEEKEFRPLGGRETIRVVDIRLISATNRDLRRMIQENTFREDLYYRLNVVKIDLPPLRERKEDVPLLVDHILEEIARETNAPRKRLDPDALRLLLAYDWPGNVRELENVIKNVCVFSEGPVLDRNSFAHLDRLRGEVAAPASLRLPPSQETYKRLQAELEEKEREFVLRILQQTDYNKLQAARLLGVTRPAFYRMLKRLDIRT
ncbi:MAG: sigma 54-interacting transcriptional regulator [Planctomycetes bacterium]|nr:sigma 54-interacting transcriptional regulator [Planctomycetota bacterium]